MVRLSVGVESPITANFGPARAGLTSVGYTLLDNAHQVVRPRTVLGVNEIKLGSTGSGVYSAILLFYEPFQGFILWDSGQDPAGIGDAKLALQAEALVADLADPQAQVLLSQVTQLTALIEGLYEENVMKIPNGTTPTAIRIIRKRSHQPDWSDPTSDTTIQIVRQRGQERFGGPPA